MVTLKDVAREAGVSVITVSRVVNGISHVRGDTRERVERAIERLQYVPNRTASNLRSQQSDTVALLLPDITNSFWTTIARGVEDEAWDAGYGMFLCNTDNDPAKEARYLDILMRRRVEGVIIVPTPANVPLLRRLQQRRINLVILHRTLDGIEADVVRSDSRGGSYALTRGLLDAGYRRIAYVGGPPSITSGRERLAGYTDALRSAGLDVDPVLVRRGAYDQRNGYRMVEELVQDLPRPEALVIGNSRLAIGALRALADAGLAVPEEMAVAAFHDITALDDYSPLMTTAVQPAYEIGRLGARRLLDQQTQAPLAVEEIILPNRITVRRLPRARAEQRVAG